MSNNDGILFIHGAGLGSFIWKELQPLMESSTLAIDFPNRETDGHPNIGLTLDAYLSNAIEQIERWEVKRFTIVAHSIGGCIALKINDYFKDRVSKFIGIGAIIPPQEKSFLDCFPFPQNVIMKLVMKLFGTKPPKKSIENELCNDLNSTNTAEILKRFSTESLQLFTSKIYYSTISKDRLYIKLKNDKAISQSMQNQMVENLKPSRTAVLESGHLPMISKPKELAEIIRIFHSSTR